METGMFNIGLDYKVTGGRLSGTIEYYHKKEPIYMVRLRMIIQHGVWTQYY